MYFSRVPLLSLLFSHQNSSTFLKLAFSAHKHMLIIPQHNLRFLCTMSLRLSSSFAWRHTISLRLVIYAATWTTLLTLTVVVASFSSEMAFVSAVSPSSSFSGKCSTDGFIRLPLDAPRDVLCFPPHLLIKSKIDFIVPPVFTAVIVAASAFVVRALGLWEDHQSR